MKTAAVKTALRMIHSILLIIVRDRLGIKSIEPEQEAQLTECFNLLVSAIRDID